MKKFEMPEVQVVTFDEDIMAINVLSTQDAGQLGQFGDSGSAGSVTGVFTPDDDASGGWF